MIVILRASVVFVCVRECNIVIHLCVFYMCKCQSPLVREKSKKYYKMKFMCYHLDDLYIRVN